jgi:hypothetical protein
MLLCFQMQTLPNGWITGRRLCQTAASDGREGLLEALVKPWHAGRAMRNPRGRVSLNQKGLSSPPSCQMRNRRRMASRAPAPARHSTFNCPQACQKFQYVRIHPGRFARIRVIRLSSALHAILETAILSPPQLSNWPARAAHDLRRTCLIYNPACRLVFLFSFIPVSCRFEVDTPVSSTRPSLIPIFSLKIEPSFWAAQDRVTLSLTSESDRPPPLDRFSNRMRG